MASDATGDAMKLSRLIYSAFLWLLRPFLRMRLRRRARKQPEYAKHVEERFGDYSISSDKPVIWLHAVSLGETRAAEPLVKQLLQQYSQYQILLTHMTPTGRAAGKELFGAKVMQCYLPYDYSYAAKKFLAHFRPVVGIVMETEIWPNLFAACQENKTPLMLVNARLSQESASRYAYAKPLVAEALASLHYIAAQTEGDAHRLRELGGKNISVCGNMKFDVSVPEEMLRRGEQLRHLFGPRPIFLAASTRDGEESQLIDNIKHFSIPNLLVVIVPRHPQRFEEIAALIEKRSINMQRRSANETIHSETKIVLGDSMGEMFAYYQACDVAFIGGSLLPLGGQNIIEACAVGKPVIVGPHTFNFKDAVNNAVACGAAVQVNDIKELVIKANELLSDKQRRQTMGAAGKAFCAQHCGATARTLQLIKKTLGERRVP
ncbi:MAG: lipid IV(A) 3-deoxy-D-manno-octulosonic acid transferase [Burkholderiales bacterium]